MSKEYPFVTLIKIISSFDYKDFIIRKWDNERTAVTINEMCHIIGINTGTIDELLNIWSDLGLAEEVKGSGKERYLSISKKIISNIEKGNNIRHTLKMNSH